MIRRMVAALAAAGAATALFAAPAMSSTQIDDARRAAAYLAGLQGDDGAVPAGWRGDQVAEAVVALVAGGGQHAAVERAVEHLAATADGAASSGPFAGRIAAAAVVTGRDPRHFGGVDLVARIESAYDPVTASYGGNVYGDTLAMLGLLSAGAPVPDGALTRLRLSQCRDGSWSYQSGCLGKGDTDTTSMVVAVLAAATPDGRQRAEVASGRAWLVDSQRPTGCWGYEAGAIPNANSCGLVLSTIAGLSEDPASPPWTGPGGRDPLADLHSLQLPSGAFQYRKDVAGPNDYATVQAIPGLVGWAPVRRPAPTPTSATTLVPRTSAAAQGPTASTAKPPPPRTSAAAATATATAPVPTLEPAVSEADAAPGIGPATAAAVPAAAPRPRGSRHHRRPWGLAAFAGLAAGAAAIGCWRRSTAE